MNNALRLSICLTAVAACMGLSASAQAETVTVGSPLTEEFLGSSSTTATATWANIELPEAGAHPSSPISGTVVSWRMKGGFVGGPFMLQVLKPEGSDTFAAVATSAPQTPSGTATQTFSTDLPIEAGDVVGIETSHASDKIGVAPGASGVNVFNWIPPLVDGGPAAAPHTFLIENELGFNADVESPPAAVVPTPAPAPAPSSLALPPVPATCKVPRLTGKKLKAARKSLARAGCRLGTVKKLEGATAKTGKVTSQSPKADKSLAAGSKVAVKLS